MKAIHLHTEGIDRPDEAHLVETYLRFARGVADVAGVREIGLVSVLYDERQTSPVALVRAVRDLGFNARPCR